ncbi:MAG: hypothetical protein EZS28_006716 [Streblomastix strix]|uniref:Uncharacterized protein n=1 Tax=Streblomastix strix TaxID=222440 RepID=A0A5J4WRK8_9EUKA|nr:MAG: hypothetical protein EZS28_006716 [Streblomastix strix]
MNRSRETKPLSKDRLILVAVVRHPANVLSLGASEHGITSALDKNSPAFPCTCSYPRRNSLNFRCPYFQSMSYPSKVTLDRYMSVIYERSRSSGIQISGESGKDYGEKGSIRCCQLS